MVRFSSQPAGWQTMKNDGSHPKKRKDRETLLFSVFFSIIGSAVAATGRFTHMTIGSWSGENVSMAGFLFMVGGGYGIWSYFSANRIVADRNKAPVIVYCILLFFALAIPFLAIHYHWPIRTLYILIIILPMSYGLDVVFVKSQEG